ncbi:MAG: Unknown protein [uncultured Sulfurovum sp.]|uniref:Uncharacterized protein n=1 Tax=uncultured Sulfurovum sp. TaxID=269237 RepID=A0A6S6TI12_9BACT|nr:MAG: Unknown protein [uncultured Sulfurovum sp.]
MRYCSNCGIKVPGEKPIVKSNDFNSINERISPKNNQKMVVKRSYIFLAIFGLLTILPHVEWSPLSGFWALSFISFFIFISSLVIMWMFRSRSEKLQTLISGENLLAEWTLTEEQKERYINYFYEQEKGKNMGILFSISFVASIVFGLFILFIEEGKLAMMGVLLALILFLSFFALVMPLYYRYSNRKEDGRILIGGKYAYINGYFHNWDFMLSGLSRITIIKEPFYGINLVYYYTDKTFRHSEEIFIPANEDIDLEILISSMKELNKLKSAPKKLQ